ncbi:hypothetical protein OG943_09890 [Amycolatopsis sp. NBC_00345]
MDEQLGQGRPDTDTLRDPLSHQLHEHRVPADLEEVVKDADLVDFDYVTPNFGEDLLRSGDRGLAGAHRTTSRRRPFP